MRVAHQIGTRSGTYAIAHARAVTKIAAVGNTEGRTRLCNRDARDLPAPEQRVAQSRSLEERQGIDVANRESMTLVKARRTPVGRDVVGIHKRIVEPIRRV